ncbi:MAG: SCO family protein [Alphaproteobacteria bacterium]|nr:SCO family protein [Alphaproteobacteria bacterium]MBU0798313.1 SCO family protein [Alphaproteobacteria bacterium]MBU0886427.1 SCO family protein [Alphaproteobacteria bacterium]MBU1813377.1 SCO family protein [Alphaproteobacteria bacterium]MBU2090641.1 SCO family protein [Alphaproteobacteria bacterium]
MSSTLLRRALLVFIFGALVLLVALAGRVYWMMSEDQGKPVAAMIGGPFELVDQNGKTRTEADFRDKYMLINFGYTYCPDVCPIGLQTMATALDLIGDKAKQVTPVFITVDPERDTVEQMKGYVEYFHPDMVGLTGTPAQVAVAAKAYRVYYKKAGEPGATDYLVDHSSIIFLMGPDGKYVTNFTHETPPERMAETLAKVL